MFIRSGYSAHTRSSGTEDHHLAARVVIGGRNTSAPGRGEAGRGSLALEPASSQAVQADDVVLDDPLARRGDRLAPALEHEPGAVGPHGGGLARVDEAVLLAHVGQRGDL